MSVTQQEMFEAPPLRRLIVPVGHDSHWGVDPSTFTLAVSGVRAVSGAPCERWVRSCPFKRYTGSNASLARLADVRDTAEEFARELASERGAPGVVWVERPGGKSRNYSLDYAVGAIVAGMDSGIRAVTGQAARFEEIEPASWKKIACGAGNLYKPDPKKGRTAEYPVYLWARGLGYNGASYDEADALGIAEAARRTVALDVR